MIIIGGSSNLGEQTAGASGSMAAGESHTAAAGVSGDISRTLSELQ